MASIKYDSYIMKYIVDGKRFDTRDEAVMYRASIVNAHNLCVSVDIRTKEMLYKLAEREDVSVSKMIRRLVEKEYEVIYGKEDVGA